MASDPAGPGPGPPLRFRTAVGPLLLYHLLILLGGGLILVAVLHGPSDLLLPGVAILIAGLVAVLAVLAWAGRMARRAASSAVRPEASIGGPRWVCTRCGHTVTQLRAVCPRCGGWLVRSGYEPDAPRASGPT